MNRLVGRLPDASLLRQTVPQGRAPRGGADPPAGRPTRGADLLPFAVALAVLIAIAVPFLSTREGAPPETFTTPQAPVFETNYRWGLDHLITTMPLANLTSDLMQYYPLVRNDWRARVAVEIVATGVGIGFEYAHEVGGLIGHTSEHQMYRPDLSQEEFLALPDTRGDMLLGYAGAGLALAERLGAPFQTEVIIGSDDQYSYSQHKAELNLVGRRWLSRNSYGFELAPVLVYGVYHANGANDRAVSWSLSGRGSGLRLIGNRHEGPSAGFGARATRRLRLVRGISASLLGQITLQRPLDRSSPTPKDVLALGVMTYDQTQCSSTGNAASSSAARVCRAVLSVV